MSLPKFAKIAIPLLLVAVAAGGAYVYRANEGSATRQTTDDAYVTADSTLVGPKVAGSIVDVLAEDHQSVRRGQLLARIDDRDFVMAVNMARAELARATADVARARAAIVQQGSAIDRAAAVISAGNASLTFARANASRYRDLASDGSATRQDEQQAQSQADAATAHHAADVAGLANAKQQVDMLRAQLAQSEAQMVHARVAVETAELNLSYTRIVAPIDGVVTQRTARVGAYTQVGMPMLAIVPLQDAYIEAHFRETQLANVRAGQSVTIVVDMLPGTTLKGHVKSVAPASSVSFAPIAPDNATGNFTKVVQRLPVKIVVDAGQAGAQLLKVGMSVTPTVLCERPAAG